MLSLGIAAYMFPNELKRSQKMIFSPDFGYI